MILWFYQLYFVHFTDFIKFFCFFVKIENAEVILKCSNGQNTSGTICHNFVNDW